MSCCWDQQKVWVNKKKMWNYMTPSPIQIQPDNQSPQHQLQWKLWATEQEGGTPPLQQQLLPSLVGGVTPPWTQQHQEILCWGGLTLIPTQHLQGWVIPYMLQIYAILHNVLRVASTHIAWTWYVWKQYASTDDLHQAPTQNSGIKKLFGGGKMDGMQKCLVVWKLDEQTAMGKCLVWK